jgi:hypothetical protein
MSVAALPLALKLSCCGLLAACVAVAYFGRPPSRRVSPRTIAVLLAAAVLAYAASVVAVVAHRPGWAAVLVSLAVLCGSLAGWMFRFERGDGSAATAPQSPPDDPVEDDWDRFERAFRSYDRLGRERERTLA